MPTPRRRRRSALSRVVMWTFITVAVLGIAGAAAGLYARGEYTAPGPLAQNQVFVVSSGQSAASIGLALEKSGVVSNGRLFALLAQLTGQRNRLKAGEYEFPRSASMRQVMTMIASGKVITYKISIPEGFTSEMAVARVNANDILDGPPAIVPAEGTILPDTYVFRRGMTRQKLVEDMQAAQRTLLDQLWAKRSPVQGIDTPEQAVTLASIVEKETSVAEERPVIASVFINRLAQGMRLQSDPTIIYGIVGGRGKLDRALTRSDIETSTPYNTYRINGLPPGPIANPGRAALEAVLNPSSTEYFYFVADGSGGHAFAATLEEHNRNVRKWREISGNAAAAAVADSPQEAAASVSETDPQTSIVPVPDPATEASPKPAVTAPAGPDKPPPEPGTIIVVDGRQAVIPRLRPAR
jgi:UPF0755 protein